jgi:polysaccharide pyruvyl transferase WcaK-like protein
LQHVDLITVRDEASRAELAAIGVTKPPIEVTADAVLSINPVSLDRGQTILAAAGVDMHRRRIGICVRDWKGMTHHQVEIAAAADALQKKWDAQIVFIPMQFPDDIKAGTAIQQRMTGKATVLQEHYSMVELMSLIGSMDVLLGIRLHALVFAALMMVPETAISYDPKIDRFIDMIGEHLCGDLNSVTAAQLIADMDRKLEARQPAADVLEHVERLRELSLRNAHLALNIIEKQRM